MASNLNHCFQIRRLVQMDLRTEFNTAMKRIRALKRNAALELAALACMVLALVGASRLVPWDWWAFAALAGMFFIAAHFDEWISIRFGPGGIAVQKRDVPASPPPAEFKYAWQERDRLELYAIANLSVDEDPHKIPVDREPQLSRLRLLKDAARDGQLTYEGNTPNMFATVKLEDFQTYANDAGIEAFKILAGKWRMGHASARKPAEIAPLDEARLNLARLRTAGVRLRNRQLQFDETTEWFLQVRDWERAVTSEIEKIDAADAEWFRTLDAVPPPRVSFAELTPEYSKTFRELDFRLVKLDWLLTKYSSTPTRIEEGGSNR